MAGDYCVEIKPLEALGQVIEAIDRDLGFRKHYEEPKVYVDPNLCNYCRLKIYDKYIFKVKILDHALSFD